MNNFYKLLLTPIDEIDLLDSCHIALSTLILIYFGWMFFIVIPNAEEEKAKEQARVEALCRSYNTKAVNTLVSTGNNRRPHYYKLMCISTNGKVFEAN